MLPFSHQATLPSIKYTPQNLWQKHSQTELQLHVQPKTIISNHNKAEINKSSKNPLKEQNAVVNANKLIKILAPCIEIVTVDITKFNFTKQRSPHHPQKKHTVPFKSKLTVCCESWFSTLLSIPARIKYRESRTFHRESRTCYRESRTFNRESSRGSSVKVLRRTKTPQRVTNETGILAWWL